MLPFLALAACATAAGAATITVQNLDDSGAGSLRQALVDAGDGDTIDFAPGLTGTINLDGVLDVPDENLTITGPGAAALTVSGQDSHPVFAVNAGGTVNAGWTVAISGMTIANGFSSFGFGGGGIHNRGTVTIDRCTLAGNRSNRGGGGIFNLGTMVITNSTLVANEALRVDIDSSGGGVHNSGTITITNSTLSGNQAVIDSGGGLFNEGSATITNSTLSGNSAGTVGGGIGSIGDTAIINSTVSGNADQGIVHAFGTLTIKNSIMADNGVFNCIIGGTFTIEGTNLSTDTSCVGTQVSSAALNLGALANNGGPTQTHALAALSPAIDAATDCDVATDQRGVARPIEGDGVPPALCDVGAYEFGAIGAIKTVSGGPYTIGSTLIYTLVVTNAGAFEQGDNPGDELIDVLPSALLLIDASADSGTATATPATNTVTWNGSLAAGASATITITAQIAVAGVAVSNQASLAFDTDYDGTNDGAGLSEDPSTPAPFDPTTIVVAPQSVLAVPTLAGWGRILLTVALAAAALVALRRT
jgi:uncharacterized repeat protein (TIGR01451 family)